jgi:hypothetical protein
VEDIDFEQFAGKTPAEIHDWVMTSSNMGSIEAINFIETLSDLGVCEIHLKMDELMKLDVQYEIDTEISQKIIKIASKLCE